MLTGNKNTFRMSPSQRTHPSLLPLRMVLIAAESEAPAQPPYIDTNEKLAAQLIARMQADYKKELPFLDRDIPNSLGLPVNLQAAGIHA
jgi:hypothetical protein